MAIQLKKSEFAGTGAAVQFVGVIFLFLFYPVGVLIGIALVLIGGRMAIVRKCSDCRGKVEKEASVCPHCRASFAAKSSLSTYN